MEAMAEFFESPTEGYLEGLTKNQLREVAEHYKFNETLPKDLRKQELKEGVRKGLVERSIIVARSYPVNPTAASTPTRSESSSPARRNDLSFEQQMELLRVQNAERDKDREEREKDRQFEFEKMKINERRGDNDRVVEIERLRLVDEGKLQEGRTGDSSRSSRGGGIETLSSMVRFLPKFNDRDPDIFFSLFEGIAEERGWNDAERTLLLQTVLPGRAQDAFVALPVTDRKCYQRVKEAVLRAYEQVPEFYRQRFRNLKKEYRQTYSEVARDLVGFFNRWCSSVQVDTYEKLRELMVLEQFKNVVPERLAMFINEHKVKTAAEAAVLADEFNLTHRGSNREYVQYRPSYTREEPPTTRFSRNYSGQSVTGQVHSSPSESDVENKCHYCLKGGHWKRECPLLEGREDKGPNSHKWDAVKGVGCAAPVRQSFRTEKSVQVNITVPAGGSGCEVPGPSGLGQCVAEAADGHVGEGYGPFITDGFVSLVGSAEKTPVKILRDTGATETFVAECVLPFSVQSSTGESVLVQGMGMQTMSVPLHKVVLGSDLVQGEVIVGVRPALPVPGVHVILGNIVAGHRVWASGSAPLVGSTKPIEATKQDNGVTEVLDRLTECVVTRAKSSGKTGKSLKMGMGITDFSVFSLFVGIILFIERALLAIVNILFITGLSFAIGLERTFRFSCHRNKGRATSFFVGCVCGVLMGWPIIGVLFETYGFFLLYRGYTPNEEKVHFAWTNVLSRAPDVGISCDKLRVCLINFSPLLSLPLSLLDCFSRAWNC